MFNTKIICEKEVVSKEVGGYLNLCQRFIFPFTLISGMPPVVWRKTNILLYLQNTVQILSVLNTAH